MDDIKKIINDISPNVEVVRTQYLSLIDNIKTTINSNEKQVEKLNNKIIELELEIKKQNTELDQVKANQVKVEEYISAIKSASGKYGLLEAKQLEEMRMISSQKETELVSKINSKIANAKQEVLVAQSKINKMEKQIKDYKEVISQLELEYKNNLNELNENLIKINDKVINISNKLIKKSEELKNIELEPSNEPKTMDIIHMSKEHIQKEEPPHIAEETQEKQESKKEKFEEDLSKKEPLKEIEKQIDNQETENEKKPEKSEIKEVLKEQIIKDEQAPQVLEKPVIKPQMDYTPSRYRGINELELTDAQKNRLINNMSPEKFSEIANILNKYDIPLKDITLFYEDFITMGEPSKLDTTLEILKGHDKDNSEKDLSYNLDHIINADNTILEENLLEIYSKGDIPKYIPIVALLSPYISKLESQAELLEIDPKEVYLLHPIASALMPLSELNDFDMEKQQNVEKSLERVA